MLEEFESDLALPLIVSVINHRLNRLTGALTISILTGRPQVKPNFE